MMNYAIPQLVREGIDDYVEHRRRQGGFVMAVLRNDLLWSIVRADSASLAALKSIVRYLHNEVTDECWGSDEKVATWLKGS